MGSLEEVTLRMANVTSKKDTNNNSTTNNNNEIRTWKERMEIVSLVGTFAIVHSPTNLDDSSSSSTKQQQNNHDNNIRTKKHLHMSLSNEQGQVYGGHLISGRVFTTVELVLGTAQGIAFQRNFDEATGYDELQISSLSS